MFARLTSTWSATHVWLASLAVLGLFLPAGLSGLAFSILFMIAFLLVVVKKFAPPVPGKPSPEPAARQRTGNLRSIPQQSSPARQHLAPPPSTATAALFADPPEMRHRLAAPAFVAQTIAKPASLLRRLLDQVHPQAYAYLRGFLGFFLTLGIGMALKSGVQASSGPLATLNILFPTAWLATVTLPILVPFIMATTGVVRRLGIRRGWADALVGIILTAIYWVPFLLSVPSEGAIAALSAAGVAFAGAMGGFEFWRAEGYPEARRSTAQWLGKLKDGFMQGLGR